jgi:hypothetical protein
MKTAVYENYKPMRYEGKGFLHRDITGEMGFGVDVFSELFINIYQLPLPTYVPSGAIL